MSEEARRKVVELDRAYRSTWDAHAIGHVVKLSATTVAKILRERRGPRPRRGKRPHTRRTRFTRRDVMWSSDFVDLGWGWLLIKTLDEKSGYRLGWDLCRGERAEAAVRHARSIVERMGRAPLAWKYDHGSAFTSAAFQDFLAGHGIVAYPIPPRAPWANGRVERDHQDIRTWLVPLEGKEPTRELLEREVDEGMLTFNFIKPRASLGFRKSAEVYLGEAAAPDIEELRGRLAQGLCDAAFELGAMDAEEPGRIRRRSREQVHRRSVRLALERLGLYEEWDVAAQKGPSEAMTVNTSKALDVAF